MGLKSFVLLEINRTDDISAVKNLRTNDELKKIVWGKNSDNEK